MRKQNTIMKIKLFFLASALAISCAGYSQIYMGKTSVISFFSHGPIEDIAATTKSAQVMLNTSKGDVAVKVTIKGFAFDKKLMEEHFNEKYMESDKFPYATFSGKVKDTLDYKKDGVYKVTVVGKLNMHGVEKERTIPATVTIKGFTFEKKLMEEHFNEKYMESDKYPYATFTGKINEAVDYKKEGTYKVTITGKLNIHGVEKERTIDGTLTIKGGEISLDSKFNVALKDHKVEIPTLVAQNIAEVVEVTIKATLMEFKK